MRQMMKDYAIGLFLFPPRLVYALVRAGVSSRVRRAVYG